MGQNCAPNPRSEKTLGVSIRRTSKREAAAAAAKGPKTTTPAKAAGKIMKVSGGKNVRASADARRTRGGAQMKA